MTEYPGPPASGARFLRTALARSIALSVLAAATAARADEWTGAVSDNWFNAANWADGTVPTSSDDVNLDVTIPYPALVNGGNAVARGLRVGVTGTGFLTIGAGGTVTSLLSSIGYGATGSGGVLVTGAGSSWDINATNPLSLGLIVGNEGTGELTISDGGAVNIAAVARIGSVAGSSGTVTVSGDRGWSDEGLYVGFLGEGELTVSGGGTVDSLYGHIGRQSTSTSTVTISSPGSSWTTRTTPQSVGLYVGNLGTGEVMVSDGGAVSTSAVRIGNFAGASGLVTVDGLGTTWSSSGEFHVGEAGTGSLVLSNGGAVSNTFGFVGVGAGSTGTVTVTGTDSLWTNTNTLTVGAAGTGELTVSQGTVIAPKILVGTSGQGTVNIGAAVGEVAAAPGILDTSDVVFGPGGSLVFNHTDTGYAFKRDGTGYVFAPALSGAGSLLHLAGTTNLSGISSGFTGTTSVTGGTLLVDGTLGGTVNVASGGALGGIGTLDDVTTIAADGTLIGRAGETLSFGSDLILDSGAHVAVSLGTPDTKGLFDMAGDLTLDGTLDITDLGGFSPGLYRLFDYDGSLTDNGLEIGALPSGIDQSDLSVQTSVSQQVNLVNTSGVLLNFWDGDIVANHHNGVVDGGSGIWNASHPHWTESTGAVNGAWDNGSFAVFAGAAGTVTVDGGRGAASVAGMQFATDGYRIEDGAIALALPETIIRTGFGDPEAGTTATIASELTGSGGLVKTDYGTLVLTGANTYSGGTTISAGALQLGEGGTGGYIFGDVANDGVLAFNRSDIYNYSGTISGSGEVNQIGAGTTILNDTHDYTGGTRVLDGTLAVGDANHTDASLSGNGGGYVARGATLGGYGSVTGTVINDGTIAVADAVPVFSGGAKGSFTINSGLVNNALVRIAGSGIGNSLEVSNYVGGPGSVVALNTYVGGDGSPSDLLVIDGGSATGNSALQVNQVGGGGALTTGNGILLVDATDGATTAASAFTLGNRVIAGPYEYRLFRSSVDDSNPQGWYLRSTRPCEPPAPPAPPEPCDPSDPDVPNYRPETSLYRTLPALAQIYNRTVVDTLHERLGDIRWLADTALSAGGEKAGPSLAWGRLIYQNGDQDLEDSGTKGTPAYDYNLLALQTGLDFYRSERRDGGSTQIGAALTLGRINASVEHETGDYRGRDHLRVYGLNGYWTRFGASGWYLDAVLQADYFDARAEPAGLDSLDTDGWGFGASLEGGYPFEVGRGLLIEPQAQVAYNRVDLDDTRDVASRVRFDAAESLIGRLGLRFAKDWRRVVGGTERHTSVWLRPSVWRDFEGDTETGFSSETGFVPFETDIGGSWGEINLGVDHWVDHSTTV